MPTLRDPERKALAKLLADDDPRVLRLLEEKLSEMGNDAIAALEFVESAGEPSAQQNARQMLRSIQGRKAWEAFHHFCATGGEHFDLETAAWLLAKTRYPELDELPYRVRLDQMAKEFRERLTGRETPRGTIEVCNRYLFHTLGFSGNKQDYYDDDNSYLNRVLDRRLGIPISLCVLYLLLARRLSLPLIGISLPAHFLLKWQAPEAEFFIDTFHEGALLDEEDCRELCARLGVTFQPAFLLPATPRIIVLRMCNNLHAIYADREPARAEKFAKVISLLMNA
ncbi:MAG TPA: transglutaminase-like domain-containing protein [Verrucomicrobiae bacterium]|nr:transglutaminase-like domain-containing protein [Verrucomicrobiae bacterium]